MRIRTAAVVLAVVFAATPLEGQDEMPVRVLLFGDMTYSASERPDVSGFSLGQVVGHLSASLSDRLSGFAEVTLTPKATSVSAGVERLILRYDVSDRLKISAGRYHTPITWWNTAFHHGSWLQPSIERPRMVKFGTPLMPIHFLGVLASGNLPAGPTTVVYEAGIGNGRQAEIAQPGDAGDFNQNRALVGSLRVRPLALPGLEIGGSGYVDRVDVGDGPVNEHILAAHAILQSRVDLMAEFMRVFHRYDRAGAETFDTDAWYVEAGYRLPEPVSELKPYGRLERISPPAGDPLFQDLGLDYENRLLGLRWDFADFASLKAEYRSEKFGSPERYDGFFVNASFVIPNVTGGAAETRGMPAH